jgi:hypothetical protein
MTRSRVTVCAVASLPIVAALLAGCGGPNDTAPSGTSAVASGTSAAAQPASPAAASSPACDSQIKTWWSDGAAQNQMSAIGNDVTTLMAVFQSLATNLQNGADASGDEGTIRTTDANLKSNAQALQADRPPSCLPHMGADLDAATAQCETTVIDAGNALNQLPSGSKSVAVSDIQAATQAVGRGSAKLTAATGDLNKYVTGQG